MNHDKQIMSYEVVSNYNSEGLDPQNTTMYRH